MICSVDSLSSEDVAVVVDFHWFTDFHLEAIFNMNTSRLQLQSPTTVNGKDVRHRRFSLNAAQHDILPHRQSQLSDLTIRLHITTSLKSISQKRWLYHLIFKWSFWPVQFNQSVSQPMSRDQSFFVLIGQNCLQLMSVMIIHKYVIFRHQLLDLSKISNGWSLAVTVLQRKASMQQIGLPISASN